MVNHSDTPGQSISLTPLAFPPIPLASGDAVPDAERSKRLVTAMRVLVSVEGTSEPVEVSLEYRCGGWWAPVGQVLLPGQPRQQAAGAGR